MHANINATAERHNNRLSQQRRPFLLALFAFLTADTRLCPSDPGSSSADLLFYAAPKGEQI